VAVGTPIVGDWDGSGSDTAGMWVNQSWYLSNCHCTTTPGSLAYGRTTDIPIVGDWDGDGDATVGVYRPSTREFFLNNDNDQDPHDEYFVYGFWGAIPIAGDWDGDGVDTVGVHDGNNCWYLRNQHAGGSADYHYCFGASGDKPKPVTGDWNGQ
jgi:hypothetical protein